MTEEEKQKLRVELGITKEDEKQISKDLLKSWLKASIVLGVFLSLITFFNLEIEKPNISFKKTLIGWLGLTISIPVIVIFVSYTYHHAHKLFLAFTKFVKK